MVTERKGSKTKVAARTRAPQGPAVALLPYDDRVVGVEVRRPKRESPNAYVVETMKRVKRGEAKASAAWTLHFEDGLDLFNRLSPSAWWVRAYDLERILVSFGLGALDGIVACGLGAPSETVSVAAHIDSPRVAPMMAEAYARLAKQRAIAEKWLFDFPEAAAIGLVPLAAIGRGKACAHGRSALARLIDGGKGEIVREVAARYGLAQTDALGELLSRAPKAQSIGAVPDLDEEVRELERTLLRATPSTATYEALDRLTKVDTDRALFAVAELTTRARSRPLRARAEEALDAVRSRRGLSEDDLAVRMIPRLGLDDAEVAIGGALHRLAASPLLEPRIITPDGERLAKLPRGAPEPVKKRWALLEKELKTFAQSVRARLERRMVHGAEWTGALFLDHVVGHPVLVEMARGLVFRADTREFRVAEDGTLADQDDAAITIGLADSVVIPHPLELPAEGIRAWTERFAEYELLQPFPQLDREHYEVVVVARTIPDLAGLVLHAGAVLGLERRGWERGGVDDAGFGIALLGMSRHDDGLSATITFEPGIPLDAVRTAPQQRLTRVEVSEVGASEPTSGRFLSEIARDLRLAAR